MNSDITIRQQQLLLSIIKEFIETAEAVGSISLQNKYNFKVSPATIRNEMSELVMLGYLYQKHLSSGRIPTTKGWRFFVDSLQTLGFDDIDSEMKDSILGTLHKLTSIETLIRKSINFLSKLSENSAIAIIDGDLYYAGLSELVNIPEFRDSNNLKKILEILEDYSALSKMLNKTETDDDINILIGEETGRDIFSEYAIVFNQIRVNGNTKGYIAVIGPNRMRYNRVIPAVKYISDTVRNLFDK